jgi:hypothetical protein
VASDRDRKNALVIALDQLADLVLAQGVEVGSLVGGVRLRVEHQLVGRVVQRGEAHHGVDGELPAGDLREQERRSLDQVRPEVWGAVDLGADHELDPCRPSGQHPGAEEVDGAQQCVGQHAVR